MPMRLALALARPTVRAVRWTPVALCLATGLTILVLGLSPETIPPKELLLWLRVATVFGALSVAFLLDDPAESTTQAVAVPRWYRRTVRIALVAPVIALYWALMLVIPATMAPTMPVHVAGLLLEAAAMAAMTLALSSVCGRWVPEGMGGVAAAPGLLLAMMLAASLPDSVALLDAPGHLSWPGSRYRWAAVLVLSAIALVLTSQDTARRTPLRTGRLLTGRLLSARR